jgi:hypothetical protein
VYVSRLVVTAAAIPGPVLEAADITAVLPNPPSSRENKVSNSFLHEDPFGGPAASQFR